jgi:hypothetical protein
MKYSKLLAILAFSLITTKSSFALDSFSHKFFPTSSTGQLVLNGISDIRISIYLNKATGMPIYQEEHLAKTTNAFGLADIVLGTGVTTNNYAALAMTQAYVVKFEVKTPGETEYRFLKTATISSLLYDASIGGSTGLPLGGDASKYLRGDGSWQPISSIQGTVTSATAPLNISSGVLSLNAITDNEVSGTAAIKGIKISPDFGSQAIKTSGDLTVGTAPNTFGVSGTTGDVTAKGKLDVTGASTLTGDVAAKGKLEVTGNLKAGVGANTFTFDATTGKAFVGDVVDPLNEVAKQKDIDAITSLHNDDFNKAVTYTMTGNVKTDLQIETNTTVKENLNVTKDLAVSGATTLAGTTVSSLTIGSTALTATATELNKLAGNAVTAADLTKLSEVTATSTEINKLAGLNTTTAELNELNTAGALKADFVKLHDVTATATELNKLAGNAVTAADLTKLSEVTATSTEINKLAGLNTTTAELNELNTAGALKADFVKLHDVTATATELNKLAGNAVTAADLTKLSEVTATSTEINKLAGLNTTTAELNELNTAGALKADFVKLHDVTATATEINKLAGNAVTAADLTKLSGVTATAAELNKLSGLTASTSELNTLTGLTATTAELNKLAGNAVKATDLTKLSEVTATSTEINKLAGNAVTAADLTKLSGVTATAAELNKLSGLTASTSELNTLTGITASTTELNSLTGITSSGKELVKFGAGAQYKSIVWDLATTKPVWGTPISDLQEMYKAGKATINTDANPGPGAPVVISGSKPLNVEGGINVGASSEVQINKDGINLAKGNQSISVQNGTIGITNGAASTMSGTLLSLDDQRTADGTIALSVKTKQGSDNGSNEFYGSAARFEVINALNQDYAVGIFSNGDAASSALTITNSGKGSGVEITQDVASIGTALEITASTSGYGIDMVEGRVNFSASPVAEVVNGAIANTNLKQVLNADGNISGLPSNVKAGTVIYILNTTAGNINITGGNIIVGVTGLPQNHVAILVAIDNGGTINWYPVN